MTARVSCLRPIAPAMALLLASLFGGCTTISAGSFADEAADFSAFRSFSWIDSDAYIEIDSSRPVSALARSTIETGIRQQLEDKGYAFTEDRESADMLLAFTVGARDKIRMDAYPVDYRGHWGWHHPYEHYFFRDVSSKNYTEGTLGIDIFDNETGKPVWHGWAKNAVTQSDYDNPGSTIDERIAMLFASFPD